MNSVWIFMVVVLLRQEAGHVDVGFPLPAFASYTSSGEETLAPDSWRKPQVGKSFIDFEFSGRTPSHQLYWEKSPTRRFLHSMYRGGEVLVCNGKFNNDKLSSFSLILKTPAVHPIAEATGYTFADISFSGNFMPVGILGGFSFKDYFPASKCKTTVEGDVEHVVATTKYGRAELWRRGGSESLPHRITIHKGENDLVRRARLVKDVQFDPNNDETQLTSMDYEFSSLEIESSASGTPYYKHCRMVLVETSKRRVESTFKREWKLSDILFDVGDSQSKKPSLQAKFPDRMPVEVRDAPQLPYVWSVEEQWAVPDVRFAPQPIVKTKSNRFYYVMAGLVAALVVISVVFFKYRKS